MISDHNNSDAPQIDPSFCTIPEIKRVWAAGVPFSEENLLKMSRAGRFPEFCRLVSQRAGLVLFNRQAVADWLAKSFAKTHPTIVGIMLANGFPAPSSQAEAEKVEAKRARRKARSKDYGDAAKVRKAHKKGAESVTP